MLTGKDKINILIPTYNRANLIKNCLKSIINQTYKNIEIIIYDDGSKDNTRDIVDSFNDKRITYLKGEKNLGVSFARNKLLELINAPYACWQDSDDLSNIYRIEKQYQCILKNSNSFVTTNHIKLSIESNYIEKPISGNNDRGNSFATIMFETSKFPKFIEGVNYGGEDVEWKNDLINMGYKHINIPERLYYINLFNDDRIGVIKLRKKAEREMSNKMRRGEK